MGTASNPAKSRHTLSEPVENLIRDQPCGDLDVKCDVLIVGSGYGGAIAAMRLAGDGRKVLLLERGKEYVTGDFPESLSEVPGHVQFLTRNRDLPVGYSDALFDFRIDSPVSVLVGCGLGGGSLINANVALEPQQDLYDDPSWPSVLSREELAPSFDAVRDLLGVPREPAATDPPLKKYKALERLAQGLGCAADCHPAPLAVTTKDGPNKVGIAQNACINCGNCVTGCNVGAKNTLPMNVLPLARSLGASFYTGATVLSVEPCGEPDGSKDWRVRFCRTAVCKTVLCDEVFTLRAQTVILAAGTLGSTEILMRSREQQKIHVSNLLGERFSTNGDALAFGHGQRDRVNAVADEQVPPHQRDVGPTITGYFRTPADFEKGRAGPRRRMVTVEDGAIPSGLTHVFGEVLTIAATAKRDISPWLPVWFHQTAHSNKDSLAMQPDILPHCQALLVMGDDEARYKLHLPGPEEGAVDPEKFDRARVRVWKPEKGKQEPEPAVFKAIHRLFDRVEDSPLSQAIHRLLGWERKKEGFDGGDYLPNPFWNLFPELPDPLITSPIGQLLSVHPLGGCAMGDDITSGVVSHEGQVFRQDDANKRALYKGLYVMDGAVMPCALGVNPFLTIAALAYRNAGKIIQKPDGLQKVRQEETQIVAAKKTIQKPDGPPKVCEEVTKIVENTFTRPWTWVPKKIEDDRVRATFTECMFGRLFVDPVPDWICRSFLSDLAQDVRKLNEDGRLVLKVEVTAPDVMGWLRSPNTALPAKATLCANKGRVDPPIQDDALIQLAEGEGSVALLAWDQPGGWFQQFGRMVSAGLAFVLRRWWNDPDQPVSWKENPSPPLLWLRYAKHFLRAGWNHFTRSKKKGDKKGPLDLDWSKPREAITRIIWTLYAGWNHADWRRMDYELLFQTHNGPLRIRGTKELAYAPGRKNPWTALTELPIEWRGEGGAIRGQLEVDVIRMTQRAPIQVKTSRDTPTSLAAMVSAGLMYVRVLFQTHFWSFGAPNYPDQSPTGQDRRQPGPLRLEDGTLINHDEPIEFDVPESKTCPDKTFRLRLLRYRPPRIENGAVLFIHGLATSSLTFATDVVKVNMATYFLRRGYDVWLLDYRLSIALDHAQNDDNQWTMDQIAHSDMPEAVRLVYEKTGGPVQVFAHCIGAGSLAMAILGGLCHDKGYVNVDGSKGRSMIKALITHAVHPWMAPSVANHLKINLATFFRDTITVPTFDSVLPVHAKRTATDVLIDRIAGSLPLPPGDTESGGPEFHRKKTNERMGREICNRLTLFYGFEWWHRNISEATHVKVADLLGKVNLETVRQIYFILFRRRLTTRSGANTYVRKENFEQYWTFPTLFAHGGESQLYDPVSAVSSCWRLRALRAPSGKFPASHYDVHCFEVPKYGHMDFLFGKNADTEVYPKLEQFFQGVRQKAKPDFFKELFEGKNQLGGKNPRPAPYWRNDGEWNELPPCGPILGWTRPDEKDESKLVIRLWVEPYIFAALDLSEQVLLPGLPKDFSAKLLPHPEILGADKKYLEEIKDWQDPDDPGTIPSYPCTFAVCDLTVPRDFADDLLLSVRRSDLGTTNLQVEKVSRASPHDPRTGVRIPLSQLPWFTRWRTNGKPAGSFLAGSCRYPGSPFEENQADEVFEGMCRHVVDSNAGPGVDHVLLVGDQIYADATADMFDNRELRERFSNRYREAFGAPRMRRLLASVPTYMAVDDHELDDNWQGRVSRRPTTDPRLGKYRENYYHGLAAAKAYQWSFSPRHEGPHDPRIGPASASDGLWYTFESGGLPFFVMDTRTERELRRAGPCCSVTQLIGEKQLEALLRWLDQVPANQPKFIVCGSVLAPVSKKYAMPPGTGTSTDNWSYRSSDGWAGYPKTWKQLVEHIVKKQIQKVVFLAGDYHFSALAKLVLSSDMSGEKPVTAYQIIASGLFAPLPFANAREKDYEWGVATCLPFGNSTASVEITPYLLCASRAHFVRVDTDPAAHTIGVSAWNAAGEPAPEDPQDRRQVKPPFTRAGHVVRWQL